MRIMKTSGAVLLTSVIIASQLQAGVLQHRDLGELARDAASAFVGTCLSVAPGSARFDGVRKIGYVEYTFRVHRWIKSSRGTEWASRSASRGRCRIAEACSSPRTTRCCDRRCTRSGSRYLLFLYPEDRWGLTSPVGAVQGSFVVRRMPDGEEVAVNGIQNLGLTGTGKGSVRLSEITRGVQR